MAQGKTIKIKFTDVWKGFSPGGYPLWQHLQANFPVELSEEPDFLIFSINGADHLNYNCEKIFVTHEAAFPDFRWCDYAITFRPDSFTHGTCNYRTLRNGPDTKRLTS